jgi:ABC-type phosphate/phosphonate transport system substrate-binding protein/tRNA A-37 threonylcarbamoyl transferase component Bud32
MTNRSVNFSFLADITPDLDLLHCFAYQAEMYLHLDPNTSLIKLRQFGELLAQEIAARNGESIDPDESQEMLLRRLSTNGILKQKSSNLFHDIRRDGNKANHPRIDGNKAIQCGLSDYDRALRRLKDAHQLACWFYNTHKDECDLNTFIMPPDPAIEWEKTAQILDDIKAVNQALANKLAEKELQLNELSTAEINERAAITRQLGEIKELKQLLTQELIEKDGISNRLKELEQQAIQMTSTQKQSTIVRSHKQEEKIISVIELGALEIGTVLRDRYEILSQIGVGSFGIAYIAKDRESPSHKSFVIKQFNQINIDAIDMKIAREGFDREARFLEQLKHDCIPTLYAQFEEKGQFYIVQSLVEGIPLSQELKYGEKKDEEYIKALLINVLTPLEYVHKQDIIHRDLKPANLIRRNDGGISLIDFGSVKELVNKPTSEIGTIIGTLDYMSGEQAIGQAKLSSDVYAVGKIAIQSATGMYPSELETDRDLNPIWQYLAPEISPELKNILSQMVEYNFSKRYENATEALQAVTSLNKEEKAKVKLLKEQAAAKAEAERLKKQATADAETEYLKKQATADAETEYLKKQATAESLKIIGALVSFIIIGIGIKSWDYLTKTKISSNTITVGILTSPADYRELGDYLRKELVPANYFDYLQGKQVGIIIEGDRSLSYQEVKKRLAAKKWDIVFARSPMISRFSQKQSYSYLAGMFPDKATYKSGIFVKANSPIRSINDIKSNTVVALGDFGSASKFYMPTYDLYGKTFSAKIARSESPMSMVAQGKAEVGVAAIGDEFKPNNSEFRIIHTSRDIPGSGVYLSPQLASQHEQMKQVLLAASKKITKKVNYGDVPEPNYTEFDKIIDRVDSMIECVNFDKTPTNLFCDRSANRSNK